jgi:hypothetical protein
MEGLDGALALQRKLGAVTAPLSPGNFDDRFMPAIAEIREAGQAQSTASEVVR